MSKSSPQDLESAAVAARLRVLRHYVSGSAHGSRLAFAKRMGIPYARWHNIERGLPLSKEIALHLVKAVHGLTLDWLYLGKEDGLSVKLQRDLAEAGKTVTLASSPKGTGGGSGAYKKPVTRSRA